MKLQLLSLALITTAGMTAATISSPDSKLVVTTDLSGGKPVYSVSYDGKPIIMESPLGFDTNIGDFTKGLTLVGEKTGVVNKSFEQGKIKKSHIDYNANQLIAEYKNAKGQKMSIEWLVSDNDIAFRYLIPAEGDTQPDYREGSHRLPLSRLHHYVPDPAERRHDRLEAYQTLIRGTL